MRPARPAHPSAGARRAGLRLLLALSALAVLASSCAYYNTFYLARKYYDIAAIRQPYLVDRPPVVDNQNFSKSIDYSKKVLGQYPKSKWVDDAYLLWARGLLGRDDPGQTVIMLQDFETRYPKSSIRSEAKFYLGVAYRQNRKYKLAAETLEAFLAQAPKHDLAPYAYLERARALTSLQDYAGASASAGALLERWPKSPLQTQGRLVRAEASFKNRAYASAREDFRIIGLNANTDEERLIYLLREADCLEAAKAYDEEMALLKDAQSHEAPPPVQPEPTTVSFANTNIIQSAPPPGPDNDRYGRLLVRIGTVAMLRGKISEAVTDFHSVVRDYPRTPLAAEAQYRIGYAYETAADDFEKARVEYAKVREIAVSAFMNQATERLANLDRIAKFHGTTKDTVEAKAEAGFLLAEQYLFQIEKPERALEEYRKIEKDFAGTPWGAKAIVAQAWVLSRKLDRKAEADSLFWLAVRDHPATEAQLAARDYLEMEGAQVPADWIRLPERQLAQADTMPALSPVPENATALGGPMPAGADSLGRRHPPDVLLPGATLLRPPDPLAVGPPAPGAPAASGPLPYPASLPAPGVAGGPGPAGPPAPGVAGGPGPAGAPGPPGPAPVAGARPAPDSTRVTPRDSTRAAAPRDTTPSTPKP